MEAGHLKCSSSCSPLTADDVGVDESSVSGIVSDLLAGWLSSKTEWAGSGLLIGNCGRSAR